MRNNNAKNRLSELKKRVVPFDSTINLTGSLFSHLCDAIVSQQLSLKAAATIYARFEQLFADQTPTPELVLRLPHERLRSVGLSEAKTKAVQDLAAKTIEGIVPSDAIAQSLTDEELIERLTEVRGVGKWTVEMVLMFRYRRKDVWPVDDLGVQKGFRLLFPRLKFTNPKELHRLGERWQGKRTEIAWYCWRALEEEARQSYQGVPLTWAGLKLMLWLKAGVPARLDFNRTSKKPIPLWPGKVSITQHRKALWQKYLQHALKSGLAELPVSGSEFETRVWSEVCRIPYGQTRTLAQIAQAIGHQGPWHLVRSALDRSPIPLLIPVHRVTDFAKPLSSGKLSTLHRRLLRHEGVTFS